MANQVKAPRVSVATYAGCISLSLVELVKAFALANYEHDGWDEVVEAWGDDEIAEFCAEAKAKTLKTAVTAFRKVLLVRKAYADDIRATAF